ncbi:hypothetical protein LINPERHAP1_LOCUS31322 [Linum perenne]
MSYIRLPGDSGRFHAFDHLQLMGSECSSSSSSSNLNSSADIFVSAEAQSPLSRSSTASLPEFEVGVHKS